MTALTDLLIVLYAVLVIGPIVIRIARKARIQFIFNIAMLALLSLTYLILMVQSVVLPQPVLGVFSFNPFSLFFGMILSLAMLMVNMVAYSYSREYENFALVSDFALLGMYLVASSSSLITIFLGLELMSIPSVFLILLSGRSIEAAAKYFIMAAIAIALLSFTIVLVYGATGSFNIAESSPSELMAFAAVLFVASLGFEASIFPFNVLIPDVYQGSPSPITGMLGGVNKKVGFAALMQIMMLTFMVNKTAFLVVAVLSLLTMFYGNIVALMQSNIKRMMAYSSISQAGYIMIGIATATAGGMAASLFQIFAHMFIFIGIFAIVSWLERSGRTDIDSLVGLNGENQFAAFALSLFLLSLVGLPLTTGFVGKLLLFISAVNSGLTWLALAGIVNSVISIFYYSKLIIAAYTKRTGARPMAPGPNILAVVAACVIITLFFGIYPNALISAVNTASLYLIK